MSAPSQKPKVQALGMNDVWFPFPTPAIKACPWFFSFLEGLLDGNYSSEALKTYSKNLTYSIKSLSCWNIHPSSWMRQVCVHPTIQNVTMPLLQPKHIRTSLVAKISQGSLLKSIHQ